MFWCNVKENPCSRKNTHREKYQIFSHHTQSSCLRGNNLMILENWNFAIGFLLGRVCLVLHFWLFWWVNQSVCLVFSRVFFFKDGLEWVLKRCYMYIDSILNQNQIKLTTHYIRYILNNYLFCRLFQMKNHI